MGIEIHRAALKELQRFPGALPRQRSVRFFGARRETRDVFAATDAVDLARMP